MYALTILATQTPQTYLSVLEVSKIPGITSYYLGVAYTIVYIPILTYFGHLPYLSHSILHSILVNLVQYTRIARIVTELVIKKNLQSLMLDTCISLPGMYAEATLLREYAFSTRHCFQLSTNIS